MYPYAIIGNCQVSALVSEHASIDWYCAPRPDSEPICRHARRKAVLRHCTVPYRPGHPELYREH